MPDIVTEQRKININELPVELPDFANSYEPKDSLIKKWITNWIISSIEKKKIKENDILPKKSEISNYLGVSVGTVQNAIRYIEDTGLVKSKQKLGTMIASVSNPISTHIKLTSKRDIAILALKRYIIQNRYKIGSSLPSARQVAELLEISQNTTRLAYENLLSAGIIGLNQNRGNITSWYIKKIPTLSNEELNVLQNFSTQTLVDKITNILKNYLSKNYAVGDRIPTYDILAQKLNVSIKTINDCINILNKEGIILTRRGRYGSILAKNPFDNNLNQKTEIFANADKAALYSYQKTEEKIINLINQNYNSGDKLPSMIELSKMFDVSSNTIRKALISISEDGFITFSRGRFGGTYVVEKPGNIDKQQYKWLSINPNYI